MCPAPLERLEKVYTVHVHGGQRLDVMRRPHEGLDFCPYPADVFVSDTLSGTRGYGFKSNFGITYSI